MVKEALNSDRVNYLVWRYLQESNYLETAVTLQKEWNQESPKEDLDPNGHVKHHTLVTILQKGLIYDDLERDIQGAQGRRVEAIVSHGFFGPLLPPPTPPAHDDDYDNIKKRAKEQKDQELRHSSPSKRQRLSNGHSNATFDATPMDIDSHEELHVNSNNGVGLQNESNGHAYPSPKEVEEPTTPVDLPTNGPAAGYQMRKPRQLISETTFLSTMDEPLHIVHCDWNPQDSSVLAASGSDPLIHFWKTNRSSASAHVNGNAKPSHWTVELEGRSPTRTIAAFSWSPDGKNFAAAVESEEDDEATINFYSSDGDLQRSLTGPAPPVVQLLWNQLGNLVLALAPFDAGSTVTIYSAVSHLSVSVCVPKISQSRNPQVVWTGDYDFMVSCNLLHTYHFNHHDGIIELVKVHDLQEEHDGYAHLTYDPVRRVVAAATDAGVIDIFNDEGDRIHSFVGSTSGQGLFALEWQPLPAGVVYDGHLDNVERLLVSSGEDGCVCLWDALSERKAKSITTFDAAGTQVVSLAFSPDGVFLAGASATKVQIWRTGDMTAPLAWWDRNYAGAPYSPSSPDKETSLQFLRWNSDGHKLAFANGTELAIIKWLYTPDTHLLLGEDKDTEAPMMQADVKVMDTED